MFSHRNSCGVNVPSGDLVLGNGMIPIEFVDLPVQKSDANHHRYFRLQQGSKEQMGCKTDTTIDMTNDMIQIVEATDDI